MNCRLQFAALCLMFPCHLCAQDTALPSHDHPDAIVRSSDKDAFHLGHLTPSKTSDAIEISLKGPMPSFVRVWVGEDPTQSLEFTFNADASKATLHRNKGDSAKLVSFLLAEKTSVLVDGTVVLSALDSEVVGQQAKLETHPGNHRIGYWGNADDYVRWSFKAPPGDYAVELVYSRATRDGTEVEISIDDTSFPLALKRTGSWYRYRNVPLGNVQISKQKSHTATVRVKKIVNGGVMNLKAVILTPAPLGTSVPPSGQNR